MKCGWCFGQSTEQDSKLVTLKNGKRAWIHDKCEPHWIFSQTGKKPEDQNSNMKEAFKKAQNEAAGRYEHEPKLSKKDRKRLRKMKSTKEEL